MNLKKIVYNGIKYSSIPSFIATKIYEEVTDAAEEKKKMNEVKRNREDAITERTRSSRVVEIEESSNVEGEIGGGTLGENVNVKMSGKNGYSRKIRFED